MEKIGEQKTIVFLSIIPIKMDASNIYTDLLQSFISDGWYIYIYSPGINKTVEGKYESIRVNVFDFEKRGNKYIKGLIAYILGVLFFIRVRSRSPKSCHIVLYHTPPVNLHRTISFLKKRYRAFTYLLLKDIFPQNAVDLKMMQSQGLMHKLLRKDEESTYSIADKIGCMSGANLDYMMNKFPEYSIKFEINPNTCVIPPSIPYNSANTEDGVLRLIIGGNLGLPQDVVSFVKEVIEITKYLIRVELHIAGGGTQSKIVESILQTYQCKNIFYHGNLPQEKFENLLLNCDVGIILLNPLFTIPNFPSRLLSYMKHAMPVLCYVDDATDIGIIAENAGFGFNIRRGDKAMLINKIELLYEDVELRENMGLRSYTYLKDNYDVTISKEKILCSYKSSGRS